MTESNGIWDIPVVTLDGAQADLHGIEGRAALVVNVASECGFTPQYAGLQSLHENLRSQGFTVLGFPCNQFGGQEPGDSQQIEQFCSVNYGVTFPMFGKVDVNGPDAHPLFEALRTTPDAEGEAGDVKWNFEKFLIAPDGRVVRRWRTQVPPDDPALVEAVTAALPAR